MVSAKGEEAVQYVSSAKMGILCQGVRGAKLQT